MKQELNNGDEAQTSTMSRNASMMPPILFIAEKLQEWELSQGQQGK